MASNEWETNSTHAADVPPADRLGAEPRNKDPLQGVHPGLKVPYYLTVAAAIGFSIALGLNEGLLWGAGFFMAFCMLSTVIVHRSIESGLNAEKSRMLYEVRKNKGFAAPPPGMLGSGPQGGQSHGWDSEE